MTALILYVLCPVAFALAGALHSTAAHAIEDCRCETAFVDAHRQYVELLGWADAVAQAKRAQLVACPLVARLTNGTADRDARHLSALKAVAIRPEVWAWNV